VNVFGLEDKSITKKKIRVNKELTTKLSPFEVYTRFNKEFNNAFLLESREGKEKLARFSFIGFEPSKHVQAKKHSLIVNGDKFDSVDPLLQLRDVLPHVSINKEGFLGGAVGYFSYDYVRNIEKIPNGTKNNLHFPDFEFGVFEDCIVFDHRKNEVRYLSCGEDRAKIVLNILNQDFCDGEILKIGTMKPNMKKEKYENIVSRSKQYIESGDIFQVVLSRRYQLKFKGSLINFYGLLRKINPSPYMYYIKFGDRQIIGTSPENLVRVEGRVVDTYATIAGTRPRGKNKREDIALEKELLKDKKERAEHLMLVDLTRNDVGKVAEFSSVKVPEFMTVHKFSHVQHIVSRVTGKLRKDCDCFDAFKAIFPAGTVTGAPKIRAMEIIEELEPERRGPYAGAVGYFSFNGNADFAITIRTLFADKNKAFIQAGAGIVYDSVPEREYYETENKVMALIQTIKNHEVSR